jgi:predicted metal-dependent hydrolase
MNFPFTAPKLAHGQALSVGGVTVRLKVNPRARRVSLRVDAVRREIIATAPSVRRLKDAAAFAAERLPWMTEQMASVPGAEAVAPGGVLEVLGRPCRLESVSRRAEAGLFEETDGYRLAALGDGAIFSTRALRLLKRHALQVLTERSAIHAAGLDRPLPPVSLTDAKSRWGSCKGPRGADPGSLRYSWRLVLAPDWVADYVAAHECAHLIEANHSPAFWALVRTRVDCEREARLWLRQNGGRLQAVGRT